METAAFFEKLKAYCAIPGPSGMEDAVREQIIADISGSGAEYEVDNLGNLIVFKKGRNRRPYKLLLAAHMDEVGFMVSAVTDEGLVCFDAVGGIDRRVVSGRRVRFCKDGRTGIVASKSIHIQTPEEFGKCEPISDMRIDIGCADRAEAETLVSIGDCAVFPPNYEEFGEGLIKSKAIDDRFGCAVLTELINSDLEYDTYFAFNTCEEVGCDGATEVCHRIRPDMAVILEATTAGDTCDAPEGRRACELRKGAVLSHMDGGTIYDKDLLSLALRIGEEENIPCQLKNIVAGGNEARSFQTGASGARVLAISAPTRYIHSACCVAAKEDLLAVERLTRAILERSIPLC